MPPSKEDFETLEHLGELDEDFRNPKTYMSLSHAKKVIYEYIDWAPEKESKQKNSILHYLHLLRKNEMASNEKILLSVTFLLAEQFSFGEFFQSFKQFIDDKAEAEQA